MSAFIYTGIEPDPLGGNDTIETAASAGIVGAYERADGSGSAVELVKTFTGDVSSTGDMGSTGSDPADFVFLAVGEYTTRVDVGFQLEFGNSFAGLMPDGLVGGALNLQITATGSLDFSHSLQVEYGYFAAVEEQLASIPKLAAAQNGFLDAFLAMISDDAWTTNVDTPTYDLMVRLMEDIQEINGELGQGTYGGDPLAYKQAALDRLADIKAAVTGVSTATIHPTLVIVHDALRALTDSFTDIVTAFFELEITFDGVEVDTSEIAELTQSSFDIEWRDDFDTTGGTTLFNITGGKIELIDSLANSVFSRLDYGLGVETLSYSLPVETLTGTDSADDLNGTTGDETLEGLAGDDTLSGGEGNDTLFGGDGDDTLFGGDGNDSLNGGAGNDQLSGGAGNETITGGTGDDTFLLSFGMGNDVITDFGDGVDKLIFASGSDTGMLLSETSDSDRIITLTDGSSLTLIGVPLNYAPTGGVVIQGSTDVGDVLRANTGTLADADGLGTLSYQWLRDGSAITGSTSASYTLGKGDVGSEISVRVGYTDGYGAAESLVSSSLAITDPYLGDSSDNTISGDSRPNSISGLGGDDTLNGLGDDDTIIGGIGNDRINGGEGNDSIIGDAGSDRLFGSRGDDTIYGGDGNDVVWAGKGRDKIWLGKGDDVFRDETQNDKFGADTVYGEEGNDKIFGRGGKDALYGGDGNDLINGGANGDRLLGGRGDDSIFGGDGNDVVWAGKGRDKIWLGKGDDVFRDETQNDKFGADTVRGEEGNDKLFGRGGRDILDGGVGDDLLKGGAGNDVFVFKNGYGSDTITDFQDDADTIRLGNGLWSGSLNKQQIVNKFASVVAGNIVFDFGKDELVLKGFSDLSELKDDISII